ncbi:response regulator receiver domain protein [delta proteobacterium NaphS2]|nr:response regulator receiver domain protein [delta proteobacterium NaphS2]
MRPLDIIVIDNEGVICDACDLVLTERGHCVDYAKTGKAGLLSVERVQYDLVLLDIKLPDMDGMEILKIAKDRRPEMPVIIMTGYSTLSSAVQATKLGAAVYLSKPFTEDELLEAVEEAFSKAPLNP